MTQVNQMRRSFLGLLFSVGAVCGGSSLSGQEQLPRENLQEPVVRVVKKTNDVQSPPPLAAQSPAVPSSTGTTNNAAAPAHPLDPALVIARNGLTHIRANVIDYTCYLIKRERVNGTLSEQETIFAKIRNRKVEDGKIKTPLSAYMYFMKPESVKGREVLFVEGQNNNKLLAHEAGLTGKLAGVVALDPTGMLAMRGNRYPITEVGVENLIVKLIEKGERDRKRDECQVEFRYNASINKRKCTVLQVVHPIRREYFDFNLVQVFIDDELQVPLRYAAYSWPAGVDKHPAPEPNVENLLEEYTYLNVKVNVGLTDADFDPAVIQRK